jgi:transcriptional regulator with XRE-family HTH domain
MMPASRAPSQADRAVALGARLRQLRRGKRLTQREVATQIPMSPGNLSRIENGEQGPPPAETIERLAAVLETDPAELLAVAGIAATGSFETRVLQELSEIRRELREGFNRLESEK